MLHGRALRLAGVVDERQRHQPRLGGVRLVAKHDHRAVLVVGGECVGDGRLLEQATQEGQVRLAILRSKLERRVARLVDLELQGDLPLSGERLQHVDHGGVLKQSVVSALAQHPQPRHDPELVRAEPIRLGAELLAVGADPRPGALALGGGEHAGVHPKRHRAPDEGLEVDVGARGAGDDVDLEGLVESLAGGEGAGREALVAVAEDQGHLFHVSRPPDGAGWGRSRARRARRNPEPRGLLPTGPGGDADRRGVAPRARRTAANGLATSRGGR